MNDPEHDHEAVEEAIAAIENQLAKFATTEFSSSVHAAALAGLLNSVRQREIAQEIRLLREMLTHALLETTRGH